MSRTDKDRPWWVQNFQDGPELYDHDHRHGECIEESLEYRKWSHTRSYRHKGCAKYVTVEYRCTKADANSVVGSYWPNYFRTQTCWTFKCLCPIPEAWKREYHNCENRERVACIGHTRTEYRRDDPCICDDFPPAPTCDRVRVADSKGGWRRYTWGGVPSEFVNTFYHRPERARERQLDDYVREYNTYGELEDGDFDNRQARGSARWYYW